MGSSSSKPRRDIEEMESRPLLPNPLLADLKMKEQEVNELKRRQQERELQEEHARQLALKQHKHELDDLHSKLDQEVQVRRAAEYAAHTDRMAKEQAEHLRKKAEKEAHDAEERAAQAVLAREEAAREAQAFQRAREEAEARANAHLESQRKKAQQAAEEAEVARRAREVAERKAEEAQRARQEAEHKAHTQLEKERARLARENSEREAEEARRRTEAAAKADADLELQRQEARRAAQEAESARVAREKAEQEALEAQRAKEVAEQQAGLDRREREKAEKAREEACLLAEEHEAKERAMREAAERERLERETAEHELRLQIANASDAIKAAETAKADAERKLGALMYNQTQITNQQPVKPPTPEEVEKVKRDRQYTEGLLHFAVAGVAGSGKSSLINAFRGISKGAVEAADTGVVETTTTIGRYPDPKNSRFVWYDIPGAGTASISSAHYFNTQGLYIFDCVIVLVDSRVQEIDLAILKACEQHSIPAFIVRSKSDEHIKAIADEIREQLEEESEDESAAEDKIALKKREARYASIEAEAKAKYIKETRESIEVNLRKAGLKSQKCYLVSRRVLLKMVQERKLGPTATAKVIDEQELITDALASVKERRFHARPPPPRRKWSSWVGLA